MTRLPLFAALSASCLAGAACAQETGLWQAYDDIFKGAKYIDLTHVITPEIPVWPGSGDPVFAPAQAGAALGSYAAEGDVFTYGTHGFAATAYSLPTDQLGTQLIRPPIGRRNSRRSTSCPRPTPCARWS
ncbi:cyclase family protein [Mangrovicoccus sp. HB161399]|uniref:cyclase family protein n=1 Tax=Mangrovicoccus sp. HB161399 TaxID=2720392 RepID=UPI0020A6DB02|nr:cyclase family protein [Mangrovicoccus sp. HB161399]